MWNRVNIIFAICLIYFPWTYCQVLLGNVCINPQNKCDAFAEKLKQLFTENTKTPEKFDRLENKISEIAEKQDRFEKRLDDKVSEISRMLRNLEEETSKLDHYV